MTTRGDRRRACRPTASAPSSQRTTRRVARRPRWLAQDASRPRRDAAAADDRSPATSGRPPTATQPATAAAAEARRGARRPCSPPPETRDDRRTTSAPSPAASHRRPARRRRASRRRAAPAIATSGFGDVRRSHGSRSSPTATVAASHGRSTLRSCEPRAWSVVAVTPTAARGRGAMSAPWPGTRSPIRTGPPTSPTPSSASSARSATGPPRRRPRHPRHRVRAAAAVPRHHRPRRCSSIGITRGAPGRCSTSALSQERAVYLSYLIVGGILCLARSVVLPQASLHRRLTANGHP